MSIYDYIPQDRWITREDLVSITGMSDRKIRDEINALRKDPLTIIVSSSQGKGYKRPSNVEELRICLCESKSRVNDELEKQKAIEQAILAMTEGVSEVESDDDSGRCIFKFE